MLKFSGRWILHLRKQQLNCGQLPGFNSKVKTLPTRARQSCWLSMSQLLTRHGITANNAGMLVPACNDGTVPLICMRIAVRRRKKLHSAQSQQENERPATGTIGCTLTTQDMRLREDEKWKRLKMVRLVRCPLPCLSATSLPSDWLHPAMEAHTSPMSLLSLCCHHCVKQAASMKVFG